MSLHGNQFHERKKEMAKKQRVVKCKRIKYGKEPVLHVHRYIVAIGRHSGKGKCWHWGFRYVLNLKEARACRATAPKGAVVEIHSAVHNFREAWQR